MNPVSAFFPFSLVLPNMPGVALELMRSLNDDNLSLNDLANVIGKDPALSATVLRVANTARYSPLRSISSLREATATMGLVTLRNLAMASSVARSFPAVPGLDRRRFWRRGLACAHYAGLLARPALVDPEVAYLGGLMLQTGQLLMMQVEREGVALIESSVARPGDRFLLEQARFGCSHADVTAELARRWKFPDALLQAFSTAARPLEARPFQPMGAVLHLAVLLADAMDMGLPAADCLDALAPQLVGHFKLNLDWLADRALSAADLDAEVDGMMA
ncbi:HDOD domain-containing protein [uncultured Aquabacterium sp.]|uniref:HDOD domain-containing protein n=1 Tax=Aquabacterium sp. TaxID=1872578 RepID=UPI0025F3BDFA|nr:HDOD domain-containing protein [uncultured Aquabacterium sp.]